MEYMEMSKTVLYYTSNREKPEFEERIIDNIRKNCGDIPIISVSQRHLNFGDNICVGDRGLSYINEWRQILIGAKEATTDYLVFAESDFLYPKEYFDFNPDGADIYRYDNVWICFSGKDKFFRKKYSEGAQIVRREYIIDVLENSLKGLPEWFDGRNVPYINKEQRNAFHHMPYELFHGDVPCISFKTGNGVRGWTKTKNGEENSSKELPHWGNIESLKEKYEVI